MSNDPKGDAEKIYIELGKALSRWSIVEDTLCTVFCLATGDPSTFVNAHAFWAVMSFDAKLTMTHATVCARFKGHDDALSLWQKAYNKLPRKNQKRNKLAHGTIVTFTFKPKGKQLVSQTYLCPYYMAVMRRLNPDDFLSDDDPRPKNRLSAADISEIERSFKRTDASLAAAYKAMHAVLRTPKPGASAA